MLSNRIMLLLMSATACLMASGCFSCSYQSSAPPKTVVVQPLPSTSTTVVQPAN
jgi:ABC-type phosphate/phosphonate transport system substrate-binding protein